MIIPVVYRPRAGAQSNKLRAHISGWDNDTWALARLVPGGVSGRISCADSLNGREDAMGYYLLRRLLIAIPSLLGISVVLFTVLALAPGDPFEELATNPHVPPEVRAALRAKFGLDDPVAIRYCPLARGDGCRATGASRSSAASMSTS